MTDPRDILPTYKARLVDNHLIVIPFDEDVDKINSKDEDKLVVLDHLEKCASSTGYTGPVGLVWERSDGTTGFFPQSCVELRDFARENPYKAIREFCNITIRWAT